MDRQLLRANSSSPHLAKYSSIILLPSVSPDTYRSKIRWFFYCFPYTLVAAKIKTPKVVLLWELWTNICTNWHEINCSILPSVSLALSNLTSSVIDERSFLHIEKSSEGPIFKKKNHLLSSSRQRQQGTAQSKVWLASWLEQGAN